MLLNGWNGVLGLSAHLLVALGLKYGLGNVANLSWETMKHVQGMLQKPENVL